MSLVPLHFLHHFFIFLLIVKYFLTHTTATFERRSTYITDISFPSNPFEMFILNEELLHCFNLNCGKTAANHCGYISNNHFLWLLRQEVVRKNIKAVYKHFKFLSSPTERVLPIFNKIPWLGEELKHFQVSISKYQDQNHFHSIKCAIRSTNETAFEIRRTMACKSRKYTGVSHSTFLRMHYFPLYRKKIVFIF